jgi:hypothetical protein
MNGNKIGPMIIILLCCGLLTLGVFQVQDSSVFTKACGVFNLIVNPISILINLKTLKIL